MIQWNQELYHYGIPRRSGRYKWGSGKNPFHHGADDSSKRADKKAAKEKQKQDKKETKAAKRAERKAELEKTIALNDYRRTWTEPYNAASEKFNRDIHDINEKYKDEKFDDEFKTDAGQRYIREVSAMWKKYYDEELQKRYGKYGDALNLENALMRNQYDEFIIPGYFDAKKKNVSHSMKQNERHKMSIQWNKELYHYGMPRRSGRYKWGSGEDPYHHGASRPRDIKKQYKRDMAAARNKSERDAAKYKAYDAAKRYKLSKVEDKALAKGEKYERKLLKSGADADKARAAGKALSDKYMKDKEYDIDFKSSWGAGGSMGKYRAGKVLLRDHEAERLVNSAQKSADARKQYKEAKSAAKSSRNKAAALDYKDEVKSIKAQRRSARKQYRKEEAKKDEPHLKVIDEEYKRLQRRRAANDMLGKYLPNTAEFNNQQAERAYGRNTAAADAAVRKNHMEANKKITKSNVKYDTMLYGEHSKKVRRGKKKLAKYR